MTRTDDGDAPDRSARSAVNDPQSADPHGALAGRLRSDAGGAFVLARTELLAKFRELRGDKRKLVATVLLTLVFGVLFPLIAWGSAASYGDRLAGGSPPIGRTGAVLAAVGVVAAYLGGSSGYGQESAGRIGPLVRTSLPPGVVALGRMAGELAQLSVVVVPSAAVLTLAVAVGAGGPVGPLLLALPSLPLALAALFAGRILGSTVRLLDDRLGISLWLKALLFVGVSAVVFVGTQTLMASQFDDTSGAMSVSLPPVLPGEPLQAYASVILAPLGAAPRPLGVPVALGLLAAVPLALALALRIETGLLLDDQSAERDEISGSRGVARPFTVSPAGRVAWRHLLRTRRDPRTLAHLTPLLFGALGGLANVAVDPAALRTLGPGAAVIGGVTLAGAAYCLNPLGDDRDQLALLLTSVPSVAPLLRGRALAGTALGLAIAVGIGAPLGLLDHSVGYVLGQSLLSVVLAVAGTGTALGIGAAVPKFERREYMSVERPHPSMFAVVGFLFGGMIVGAVGLVMVGWTVGGTGIAPLVVGWGVYLAVVLLPGAGGYLYAVRRFDALTLEDV